jgi:DUF4097 and DUF4098 domain-containing protein YvlB
MVTCVVTVVLILTLLASPAFAVTETFRETYEAKAGTPLTVSNKNGGITIQVWNKNSVEVVAEKKTRIGGRLKDVEIQVTVGDVLSIETVYKVKFPRVSVNYTINVPASLVVQNVKTSNGAISLEGTSGDVMADTSNGSIKIVEHAGGVQAETSNGSVYLQNIEGIVKAKTSNGAIKITDVAGIRNAKTSNGSIQAEVTEIAGDALELKTSNGRIKVFLSPTLNANVEMRTSNGKISLHGVEIITSEISKTSIKGRVGNGGKTLNVKTSNGSIEVHGL